MAKDLEPIAIQPTIQPTTEAVQAFLADQAGKLNEGSPDSTVQESLALLARAGWLGYGVPEQLGGSGGGLRRAVEAISLVSAECLTSGFVFWCQRAFIQYLVSSDNAWLQQNLLPQLLQAELSGATGLSNAMKHLAGIEKLRIHAQRQQDQVILTGFLPWVSNLRPDRFVVAVAAETSEGEGLVLAIPSDNPNLHRGEDLQLLGLQSSWTSTLKLNRLELPQHWVISPHAGQFLPQIRPLFLLLQCGLSLGVVRRSVQEIQQSLSATNRVLGDRLAHTQEQLEHLEALVYQLSDRTETGDFDLDTMQELFSLRIALTRLAVATVWLELEAKGGAAYQQSSSTARRLREVGFLPVLTPSLVQLETELQRFAATTGVR